MPDSIAVDAGPSLVLSGRLEVIALADVLQVLATAQHSGELEVENEHQPERARLVMQEGRVVAASLGPISDRVGARLLHHNRVAADVLGEALHRQMTVAPWRPIGDVLIEMDAVEPRDIEHVMVEQIRETVALMLSWSHGLFRFRTLTAEEASVRPTVGVALDTQEVLLQAACVSDRGEI